MSTPDRSPEKENSVKDLLDEAIQYNRNAGYRFYAESLEIIRDRLRKLEGHEVQPFKGTAWLIECAWEGGAPQYYCGPAEWCSNPFHARKFGSREEAEVISEAMTTLGTRKVTEHSWS